MIIEKNRENEIKEKVEQLGNYPMTKSSHGSEKYEAIEIENKKIKIIDAAKKQAEDFLNENSGRNPAITLMDVVLAANRNYNKQVQPHVKNMREVYPTLTFKGLQTMLDEKDYKEFKEVWGHADEKKFNTLTTLVAKILTLGSSNSTKVDYEIMKNGQKVQSLKDVCKIDLVR